MIDKKTLIEILDMDLPLTKGAIYHPRFRESVRVMLGKIWTNKAFTERRKAVLGKPLP
jgi:hypothetical protein